MLLSHQLGRVQIALVALLCAGPNISFSQQPQTVTKPGQTLDTSAEPLTIEINKTNQTIRVCAPEFAQNTIDVEAKFGRDVFDIKKFGYTKEIYYAPHRYDIAKHLVNGAGSRRCYVSQISSGGGLKQPSDLTKAAYCGKTEDFDAVVNAEGNLHREYFSKTYLDSKGNPVPMPWAFRFRGGEFLHQAANDDVAKKLGEAVSGDCVRMGMRTSQIVFALAKKHGRAHIKIAGEEPANKVACEVPEKIKAFRQQLKEHCHTIGKKWHCYERDLENAISEGKLPPDALKPRPISQQSQARIPAPPVVKPELQPAPRLPVAPVIEVERRELPPPPEEIQAVPRIMR